MKMPLFILLILLVFKSNGQIDSTSIYYKALCYYNSYLDSLKSDQTELFIEDNNGITEKLPKVVGYRKITILTFDNKKEIYTNHDNKIRHVKIFPARITSDLIEVIFTPYFGKYKGRKKGFFLSVSNWVTIQFKYDCNTNKFKYWKTLDGGI